MLPGKTAVSKILKDYARTQRWLICYSECDRPAGQTRDREIALKRRASALWNNLSLMPICWRRGDLTAAAPKSMSKLPARRLFLERAS